MLGPGRRLTEVGGRIDIKVEVCLMEDTDSCPGHPDATAKALCREHLVHR